jgi:hypothetical protein
MMAEPDLRNWIEEISNYGRLSNQSTNLNLASATNFRFVCERVPGVTYFCTGVTTPNLSSTPQTYDYMFAANPKFPGGRATSDLAIRFIVSEDFSNYMEMVRWLRSGVPYRDFTEIKPEYRGNVSNGRLYFLNNKKTPVLTMSFSNLIPTQISGFTLSYTDNDPPVQTATVNFVFDVFRTNPYPDAL